MATRGLVLLHERMHFVQIPRRRNTLETIEHIEFALTCLEQSIRNSAHDNS
jgi:hypothetical protein